MALPNLGIDGDAHTVWCAVVAQVSAVAAMNGRWLLRLMWLLLVVVIVVSSCTHLASWWLDDGIDPEQRGRVFPQAPPASSR